MDKKKLLFTIGSLSIGGKERQLIEIIKGNDKTKYDNYLLIKNVGGYYIDQVIDSVKEVYNLNISNFNFKSLISYYRIVKSINPDIIVSFASTTSLFYLLTKPFLSNKIDFFNASIRISHEKLNRAQTFDKYILNLSKNVISNSKSGLKVFNQLKKKNRFVLYNGFDFNRIPSLSKRDAVKRVEFDESKFNVIMVASLRKISYKDHKTYVKTAEYFQNIDKSVAFYLAGDGERRQEIETYIKDNNINNLKLIGNRDDIEALFLASDISVLTSKMEGVSNSIIESMACGTPVIATSGGGTPEVIEHGVDGFIEPFQDYEGIAQRILQLKNNKELYEEISKNAVKKVKDKFDIDIMIKKFEEIIN